MPKRNLLPLATVFLFFALAVLLKLLLKDGSLSFQYLISLLTGKKAALFIFYQLRLPALIAYISCAFLVVISTCILQTLSQNDLADPSALGYHNFALVAIALMTLYIPWLGRLPFWGILFLAGGLVLIYSFFMYWFARDRSKQLDGNLLLLTGLGFNIFFQMLLSYMKTYASQLSDIFTGLMSGNFDHLNLTRSMLLFSMSLFVLAAFFLARISLRVLQLGEILAESLGMEIRWQTLLHFALMSLALAFCILFGSSFPFVGFMALFIMRHYYGSYFGLHFLSSCLCAGAIIIFSDIAAHEFFATVLPTNIFLGLFGGLGFVLILLRRRSHQWE